MRIGIDARFYGEAGPGRYVKNIIEHLENIDNENEYIIFLRKKVFDEFVPKNNRTKKILADYKWYSWGEQLGFLFLVIKQKLDLFYVPHFNIPTLYPGKLVCAIPDIIMHKFSTERGTTLFKPYFKLKKIVYKFVVKTAVRKSCKVIVPSRDVANDFINTFKNINKDKYVISYEGIDPIFNAEKNINIQNEKEVLDKYNIKKPFLLYISSMYEHKNVLRLIEAFNILVKEKEFTGQLVLVGKDDRYSRDISEKIIMMGLKDKIIFPGHINYISDEETIVMRRNALIYVFPSLKEGFSLTPLEAQHYSLPCAISEIPCHKEIYGESVLYFNPLDIEDMANKIYMLIKDDDLRKEYIARGQKNIKKYSWFNTAKDTLDVFKGCVSI
ncbi:MAG TPA: glycosyltransferase family 1 protein [bacterium]|nr:glycosyltransferase family 1 protein [bacterium]